MHLRVTLDLSPHRNAPVGQSKKKQEVRAMNTDIAEIRSDMKELSQRIQNLGGYL